ncbi:hypothetical protein, partial [Cyclobacterium sp.]|uniref:hypothetical protein n=1 Tax=Cyclobacterium sp. TaxID=1966343 RepID=UPI0025C0B95F
FFFLFYLLYLSHLSTPRHSADASDVYKSQAWALASLSQELLSQMISDKIASLKFIKLRLVDG